jgi:hypothetical protein
MSSIVQFREAFGHLLKAIHDKLSPALWLVVFDVKFTGADAAKVIHLQQLIGLNSKDFACLFNACDLNGGKLLRNNWIQFLKEYNIDDYELDKKQVLDQRTWVLRIGDKEKAYHPSTA